MEDLLKVGVITTTHGVRGEVKVFPTTDNAERFLELEYVLLDTGRELRRLDIKNVRFFKNLVILKFDGIDNINDIEKYKGKDFCLITYEMLKTANSSTGEQKVKSSNMVFLPPLGMRFFDIHALLPYSIEVSNVLLDAIHRLWVMLLDMYKVDKGSIYLNVRPGTLTIEDEKN